MRSTSLLAILATAATLAMAPARAEDCPAKSRDMDDVIAAIEAAPSCDRAMTVSEACALGASGDVQYAEAVEKRCEADFLGKANASKKLAYKRELGVCDRKHRNKSGTMYQSFTAFCRAKVAQRYAKQALKAAR
ncbi:hypothetical protein JQ628_18150 [Bradyrhizobium lablabi]|uniref:hypothetical protein n=1 Tax=Bradyrhizobium lablabi TaxID=722472 RepID=UPI001BABA24E|nr:hypothetical protein [Bradyrhizobium lablabi]MBR1123452.1 hypothetical protein [Bradyrhizobium lablabi]